MGRLPDGRELALKLATRDAVKAAGGQEFVGAETGRAQSRISDYCSPNAREFMPLDVAAKVEALSHGTPGHPHITRALARAAGADFVTSSCEAASAGCDDLTLLLADVAGESGDLIRALALGSGSPARAALRIRDMSPDQRAGVARELDQLVDVLAGIRGELQRPISWRDDSS
jgi:hypothetical protein